MDRTINLIEKDGESVIKMNDSKIITSIDLILKLSALIIGILWGISGLFKVFLLNKFSISLNFFTLDLYDYFPTYALLTSVYLLLIFPFFLFNNSNNKINKTTKLFYAIVGVLASTVIYMFNISLFYSIFNTLFSLNLFNNNYLLIGLYSLTVLEYFSFISVFVLKNKSNDKVNEKSRFKKTRIFLLFVKFILVLLLLISLLYSSILHLSLYKIPYVNTYDIVEYKSEKYVVLTDFGENLIVSEFMVLNNKILIDNSNYSIISPIGLKIYEMSFSETVLNN